LNLLVLVKINATCQLMSDLSMCTKYVTRVILPLIHEV